ncbi:AAEL001115-PA [Aedes aegypti]|uniref:AAEL001115-PA n=1 Tax=Aedes aegypti TaxID=7159 RepID=Q17M88_AEDAE|nr:AAEL001115-PA [Aedes aegypti]
MPFIAGQPSGSRGKTVRCSWKPSRGGGDGLTGGEAMCQRTHQYIMNKTSNSSRNINASQTTRTAQNDDCVIIEDPIPVIDLCSDDENDLETSSRLRKTRRKRSSTSSSEIVGVSSQPKIRHRAPSRSVPQRKAMGTQSSEQLAGSSSPTPASVNCPICFESVYRRQAASTICGHLFCNACITAEMRIRKKCPLCKHPLKWQQVHPIYFN